MNDLLPLGLEYVPGSVAHVGLVSTGGANLTASGITCGGGGTVGRAGNELTDLSTLGLDCEITPAAGGAGSGDDPLFDLGFVQNLDRDADEEIIVIEFNAVIADSLPTDQHTNQAQIVTINSNVSSTSVVSQHNHPALDITSVVTPSTTGPNQDVEYVVTISHGGTSTADAMDVVITDVIPAGLTYDSGTGITGPQIPAVPGTDTCTIAGLTVSDGDPSGAGLSISFDTLAEGDVCEVRYTATTSAGATAGQQFVSDVDLDYTTLPNTGTSPNPTGSPPGVDVLTNRTAQTTVTVDVPDLVKSIASTDFAATPDGTADTVGDPRTLVIGESVRYRLLSQLPEGNMPNLSITDQLPTGLAYTPGTARIALISDGLNITPTPAISCTSGTLALAGDDTNVAFLTPTCEAEPTGGPFNSGVDPVWSLGTLNNTDADADDEYVLIEFDAVVVNETANQNATQLAGPYDFNGNAVNTTSNTVVVEIRESQVAMTAVATPNPADNRIDTTPLTSWDVTISNTGNVPAYRWVTLLAAR